MKYWIGRYFFAAILGFAPALAAADAQAPAPSELRRIDIHGLQFVEALPGADLSRYTGVYLEPIQISFQRNWESTAVTGAPVSAREQLTIRSGLARVMREELIQVLTKDQRYRITDAPAEDVLRIHAEIADLYINAPDLNRPERIHSYTLSAGEMTLIAELRDSVTGQLLARVRDHKRDPDSTWFRLTTQVQNDAAARDAARAWSKILRTQLDLAHGQLRHHQP